MTSTTTNPMPAGRGRMKLAARCRLATEAPAFGIVVFCAILFNAALMGLETYSGLAAEYQGALGAAEGCCLTLFTLEILLRMAAHADQPKAFFRDPWNLFDLVVVASAFVPFVRENATILRLLRLARVLRTARFLPHLRILLIAVGRSLPGTVSFLFIGALVVYVYAMIGWICFAEADPEHYGSVGRAGLTLFLLTTLDGLTDAVRAGLQISRLSIIYYASYALFASFVLVNVLIGVVLNSLDEAREIEDEANRIPAQGGTDGTDLKERIATARRALDEIEANLPTEAAGRPERQLEASHAGS
ncbi:ion transporter [Streptomyces sp. NBC_01351]|uniref:ion transporter n=1 Tax=Streptomyces sp. NBC_01351 TaxID=2903833 RepID=UPI002E2FACC9|nr:ion transporter [Streptomyces sp. NBC_01351]